MRWILALAALSASLYAQSPLGNVTGLALDPSGAPVPEVKVLLKNEGTGVQVEARNEFVWQLSHPNLAPGAYSLTAEAKGFCKLQVAAFDLAAFRTVRQDLRLQLASSASEITVSEAAARLGAALDQHLD